MALYTLFIDRARFFAQFFKIWRISLAFAEREGIFVQVNSKGVKMIVPKHVLGIMAACSTHETRYAINGVNFSRDPDGSPRATATDGHVLVTTTWTEPVPKLQGRLKRDARTKCGFILPLKFLKRLAAAVTRKEDMSGMMTIEEGDENRIRIETNLNDGCVITDVPKSVSAFPPYKEVIPKYNVQPPSELTKDIPAIRIGIGPVVMAKMMEALREVMNADLPIEMIVPTNPTKPIMFKQKRPDDGETIGVLMPCSL